MSGTYWHEALLYQTSFVEQVMLFKRVLWGSNFQLNFYLISLNFAEDFDSICFGYGFGRGTGARRSVSLVEKACLRDM